jgi:hypothetical protein
MRDTSFTLSHHCNKASHRYLTADYMSSNTVPLAEIEHVYMYNPAMWSCVQCIDRLDNIGLVLG